MLSVTLPPVPPDDEPETPPDDGATLASGSVIVGAGGDASHDAPNTLHTDEKPFVGSEKHAYPFVPAGQASGATFGNTKIDANGFLFDRVNVASGARPTSKPTSDCEVHA